MQRMLASLEAANGNGTSMITLLLPPRFQLCRAAAKLTEELGTASNIKKTANRNSVKEAIVSAQQKLKLVGICALERHQQHVLECLRRGHQ